MTDIVKNASRDLIWLGSRLDMPDFNAETKVGIRDTMLII